MDVAERAVAASAASHDAHLEDARRALGLDDCRRAHHSGGANLEEVSTIHLLFPFLVFKVLGQKTGFDFKILGQKTKGSRQRFEKQSFVFCHLSFVLPFSLATSH